MRTLAKNGIGTPVAHDRDIKQINLISLGEIRRLLIAQRVENSSVLWRGDKQTLNRVLIFRTELTTVNRSTSSATQSLPFPTRECRLLRQESIRNSWSTREKNRRRAIAQEQQQRLLQLLHPQLQRAVC